MLVLTRKPQERIVINGNIVLIVLQVDGDQVKLGIEAPTNITVVREEICEELGSENVEGEYLL